MDYLAEHLSWMAWTWQTAVFFLSIAVCLTVLTVLAVVRPETPRIGILRIATTRGDRFFVSLMLSAFVFLFFIRIGGENFVYPAVVSLLLAAVMFRFA